MTMNQRKLRQRTLNKAIAYSGKRIRALKDLENRFSWYRILAFFGGLGIAFALYWVSEIVSWVFFFAAIIVFNIIAYYHRRIERSLRKHTTWGSIKATQLARMQLEWDKIPESTLKPSGNTGHPFESDLDITGRHSLHQLLDIAISREGSRLLGDWLLTKIPDPQEIEQRQKVIRELANLPGFWEKLLLKFKLVSEEQLSGKELLQILNKTYPSKILGKMLLISAILAAVNVILFGLYWFGVVLQPYWILTFAVYVIIYFMNQQPLGHAFSGIDFLDVEINKIKTVLSYLESYPYHKNTHLAEFCHPFREAEQRPSRKLKRIKRIVAAIGLRMNPVMQALLNVAFPYDFYFARRLETCKNMLKTDLSIWLELWARLEAMISLANFAWLNPETVFPEILPDNSPDNGTLFSAEQLGHPLLPYDQKVCNDFTLHCIGETVLITGSNMAGKSTFLKTLGVNLVLAYAGGAVDARSFRTSLFRLFTSIKVTDSVTDGISYFYAEVRRLKSLLAALRESGGYPVFFLIDEIFRGTNNRERYIGSQAYIRTLAGQNGLGAISTHDLELTNLADEIELLSNYHFREEIVGGRMVFDFRLRPGPCPTTNALIIMKLEGLPV